MNSIIGLLLVHYITDFILQPREIAKTKSTKWSSLLIHGLIIFVGFYVSTHRLSFCLLYSIIHCLQDRYIWRLYGKIGDVEKYWEDSLFYDTIGLDQLLHTITLILLWRYV